MFSIECGGTTTSRATNMRLYTINGPFFLAAATAPPINDQEPRYRIRVCISPKNNHKNGEKRIGRFQESAAVVKESRQIRQKSATESGTYVAKVRNKRAAPRPDPAAAAASFFSPIPPPLEHRRRPFRSLDVSLMNLSGYKQKGQEKEKASVLRARMGWKAHRVFGPTRLDATCHVYRPPRCWFCCD